MIDFVSHRYSGLALLAALSVIFLACSIFIPYGFPWMGLGWVGLALVAAGWKRIRPARSIYGVLHDVEAEPFDVATAETLPISAGRKPKPSLEPSVRAT